MVSPSRCDGGGAFCARERARLGSGIMVIMWVFLTRRLRRWLFFALGAPVLGKVGDQLEAVERLGFRRWVVHHRLDLGRGLISWSRVGVSPGRSRAVRASAASIS